MITMYGGRKDRIYKHNYPMTDHQTVITLYNYDSSLITSTDPMIRYSISFPKATNNNVIYNIFSPHSVDYLLGSSQCCQEYSI